MKQFTRLVQLVSEEHGLCLSHHKIIDLVHDADGAVDVQRRAEVAAWANCSEEHWPAAQVIPRRVSASVDGIMSCMTEHEVHPVKPNRQRLKWQQMRVGCVSLHDEHKR